MTRLTLAALAAGLISTLLGIWLIPSAIYAHRLTHPGCNDTERTPLEAGIASAQAISYRSHDGLTLQAWYAPPQNGVVIILLPGLGGGRDSMLREGAILARHGYGLLLTELRSCAHPEGQTTLGYKSTSPVLVDRELSRV